MTTRIVIDSTTDMPQSIIDDYGIVVLPLHVLIEGKEYLDGIDIQTNEVYDYMRQDIMPKTSQIEIPTTADKFRECLDRGEDLLYLAFSSKMSGTCQLVMGIMDELRASYPDRKMLTLDSRGGSFATGLITIETAKSAAAGDSFEQTEARARFLIDEVEHVFCITDLLWMIRGGRISKTLGYTASVLNIKPVLDVQDGEMEVIAKVRGRKKALNYVADIVAERAKECPRQTIGITHADDMETALYMQELLHERLPEADFLIEQIGAVLGVHIGIGGVGVFFFRHM